MRTPFGRAGEKGMYWNTRADDLAVKATIGLMERNPGVPAGRIDDVAIAATSQTGDQGLTLGPERRDPRGSPPVGSRLRDRPHVRGRHDERDHDGRLDRRSACTTSPSPAVSSTWATTRSAANADPNPRFVAEKMVDPGALNMGVTAERIFDRFPHLTKERSDRYGMLSQHKVQAAYDAGKIQPDLVPVAIKDADGAWGLATEDEGRRPQTTMEDLAALKTPFRPHGRVTAGTSSPLTDGATMSLLAGGGAVKELGLAPKMKLVSFAFAGVQPEIMGIGPIPSTEKALKKAGLTIDDIGLFELNEAFAIQVISLLDHFGIADDDPRVNQWGGAIALGHPLAASGVRLMIQLAAQFAERPDVRYGLTAMCVGLGQGGSVIWENPHYDGKKK